MTKHAKTELQHTEQIAKLMHTENTAVRKKDVKTADGHCRLELHMLERMQATCKSGCRNTARCLWAQNQPVPRRRCIQPSGSCPAVHQQQGGWAHAIQQQACAGHQMKTGSHCPAKPA